MAWALVHCVSKVSDSMSSRVKLLSPRFGSPSSCGGADGCGGRDEGKAAVQGEEEESLASASVFFNGDVDWEMPDAPPPGEVPAHGRLPCGG